MTGGGALCVVSYLLASLSPDSGSGAGWLRPLRPVRGNYGPEPSALRRKKCPPRAELPCLRILRWPVIWAVLPAPTLVGMISDAFDGRLTAGLLAAIIFPLLLLAGLRLCKK